MGEKKFVGTIKALCSNPRGHFGFIVPDRKSVADGEDCYFSERGCRIYWDLAIGDRVEFHAIENPDGKWRAGAVEKI